MLTTGTEIGGYRIEAVLGRGGMGVVYEATQLSLGRTVALKLLAAEVGDDEGFRERFRREARMQARIDHNHIVPVYEAGEVQAGLFIAMRLIRGPSLKQLIRSREMTPQRALPILLAVADALDTAHGQGLIHRDVKPQNILVGQRDHAYLADFGLTKASGDSGFTRTGQVMGTLDYIAPEQLRGEEAKPASDVYSLAAVAYECIVGKPPFARPTEAAVLYAHVAEPPPSVSAEVPEVGTGVDAVITRGLAKDPGERFPTALSLVEALEAALVAAPSQGNGAPQEPDLTAPIVIVERPESEPDTGPSTEILDRPQPEPDPEPELDPEPEPGESTEQLERPAARRVATEPVEVPGSPTVTDLLRPPEPAAEVAPTKAPRRVSAASRLRPAHAALAAAAALAVVVAAYLAGDATKVEPEAPPAAQRVLHEDLSVQLPSGWRRASTVPRFRALTISRAAAVQPPDGAGAVVFGIVDGAGPTLLPASLREALGQLPEPSATVRLGKLEAYRYDDLSGTRLYVSPATSGVVAIACTGVPEAGCDSVAASVRAGETLRPLPLGPSEAYGKAVGAALKALERSRSAGLRKLRAASRPASQADGAAAVADAYGKAASTLAKIETSPLEQEAHPALVDAMQRARGAYRDLAAAARSNARSRYAQRRTAAAKADDAARSAVASLSGLGYEVG